MRVTRAVLALLGAGAVAACGSSGSTAGPVATDAPAVTSSAAPTSVPAPASSAAATAGAASASSTAAAGTSAPASAGSATAAPATASVTLGVPEGDATGAFATKRTVQVPPGASVAVWALVPGARFIVQTPQKDLIVSVPSEGKIVRLRPQADGSAGAATTVVSGLSSPQGMAFDTVDGKQVLYVAENDALLRYPWDGTGVGAATTVLSGLPGAGAYAHPLKEVVVAPDHGVYLDLASATNLDPADRNVAARIIHVAAGASSFTTVMTGVRNGDGLSFDPMGRLWTAVNMRDNITVPTGAQKGQVVQSYVNDHPPDELAIVTQGRDLGWPYCDPDQDLATGADHYASIPLRNDPETDSNGAVDCSTLPAVDRGIPAHSAPLGFHFLEGSSVPAAFQAGAVLGTHGSNDHVPPRAAELYWLPWTGTTLGAVQPLLAGFDDAGGDRWGKPVDAAPGADGSLYVTDDTAGAVYRLTLPS